MFERFTERARQTIMYAQEAARERQHNYIGSEHVLLGLVREEEGLGARVLASMDVTEDRISERLAALVPDGEAPLEAGPLPFTPRAKKICELALREALGLGHNYIGTEHILLGMVRENEGCASRMLLDFDVDSERVRGEVRRLLGPPQKRPTATTTEPTTNGEVDPAVLIGLASRLTALAHELIELAGKGVR